MRSRRVRIKRETRILTCLHRRVQVDFAGKTPSSKTVAAQDAFHCSFVIRHSFSACRKSSIKSSLFSRPTEMRIRSGATSRGEPAVLA